MDTIKDHELEELADIAEQYSKDSRALIASHCRAETAIFSVVLLLLREKKALEEELSRALTLPAAPSHCQYPPTCLRPAQKGDYCELHVCTEPSCSRPRFKFFHRCEEH